MKSTAMKKTTIEEMIKETVRETMRKEGNIIQFPNAQPEKSEAKRRRENRNTAMQKLRDQGVMVADIAEVFGVCEKTVLLNTKVSPEMKMAISRRNVMNAHKAIHLLGIRRKEYYVPLMLGLRRKGYSNAEIGQKTGFSRPTVWKYIGAQPDEITLSSMRAVGAKRRFRNLAVRNQPARDAGKPIPAVEKALKKA